jgi:hypothetical protein
MILHVLACDDIWVATCLDIAEHSDAVLPAVDSK